MQITLFELSPPSGFDAPSAWSFEPILGSHSYQVENEPEIPLEFVEWEMEVPEGSSFIRKNTGRLRLVVPNFGEVSPWTARIWAKKGYYGFRLLQPSCS